MLGDVRRLPPRSLEDKLQRVRLVELQQREIRARLAGDTDTELDCKLTRLTRLRDAQRGRLDEEPGDALL